jgi:uncharacterized protein YacL
MSVLIVRILYFAVAVGAALAYVLNPTFFRAPPLIENHPAITFTVMVFAALMFLLLDVLTPRKRVEAISAIYFGLLVGMLLSHLLNLGLSPLLSGFGEYGAGTLGAIQIMTSVMLPYICITFLLQTKDQFRFVIPYVEFSRELKGGRPLVLDSSALIDGRIADVIDTNVMDTQFVVPQFILHEVQDIADSHDKVRRSRGRRGLDVLKRLQQNPKIEVKVHESDATKGKSVDQRLVETCRQINGRLVTNDINLNKLASVQGVEVVNLNDVANALKPKFIPGEQVRIKVIKEGEGQGQGIGYLDDGTMVVVEAGIREIGNEVDTVVTSVLQNSAGRMLFTRLLAEMK